MGLFKKGNAPLPFKRVRFDLGEDSYINVRELSAQELIQLQGSFQGKDASNIDFIYQLIATFAVDDDGKALFTDTADVKDNFQVGLSTLSAIQKTIMDTSGLEPKN